MYRHGLATNPDPDFTGTVHTLLVTGSPEE
jgi:hypothetical protein